MSMIRDAIDRISKAKPSDVQGIAGPELELLASYHDIIMDQSRRCFFWALIGAGIGLLFFMLTVLVASYSAELAYAVLPLLCGAIVSILAGLVFFLYGKLAAQLSSFHAGLETLQRYLLANSICESLNDEDRTKARVALIKEISRSDRRQDGSPLADPHRPRKKRANQADGGSNFD
jgi:hypothetical protein